jgi:hypothetical protein
MIINERVSSDSMKKILIVGTVPYNPFYTSRAFETYFYNWDKNKLAQVFSNKVPPLPGFYRTLYQITDEQILRRLVSKKNETGIMYSENSLTGISSENNSKKNRLAQIIFRYLYKIGKNKNSLTYLLRKIIWNKKYWNTNKFNNWLDEFNPDVVFLSFSDDFFIPEIALFIAKKYSIPIISSIGDDYYFNYKFSLSPLYHLYKKNYRKLIREVFIHKGSAIYIGDKIRHKYNLEFNLNGKTVLLSSTIKPRDFKPINTVKPIISYFGNIRLGRNESLIDIALALKKINESYVINVYSSEENKKYLKEMKRIDNIKYHGAIPYNEVQEKTIQSDLLLIVEGFKKKDIEVTRYSLSTKVADSISSGSNVFAYGSIECGAIEYAKSIECITTVTEPNKLEESLRNLINKQEVQYELYLRSREIVKIKHDIQMNSMIFSNVVEYVTKGD